MAQDQKEDGGTRALLGETECAIGWTDLNAFQLESNIILMQIINWTNGETDLYGDGETKLTGTILTQINVNTTER